MVRTGFPKMHQNEIDIPQHLSPEEGTLGLLNDLLVN